MTIEQLIKFKFTDPRIVNWINGVKYLLDKPGVFTIEESKTIEKHLKTIEFTGNHMNVAEPNFDIVNSMLVEAQTRL